MHSHEANVDSVLQRLREPWSSRSADYQGETFHTSHVLGVVDAWRRQCWINSPAPIPPRGGNQCERRGFERTYIYMVWTKSNPISEAMK